MSKVYTFFDTETTGFVLNRLVEPDRQPRVTEFCAIVTDENFQQIDELDFLCNPGIKITPEIVKITGITDQMVKDEPPFVMMADQVRRFVGPELGGKLNVVVGHNLNFDISMINAEFNRLKIAPVEWAKILICTVNQTEHLKGHRLSLSALHELLFGEKFEGAHRAKVDVHALIRCFAELKKLGEV